MSGFQNIMGQVQEPDAPPPDSGDVTPPVSRLDFGDDQFQSVCKLVGLPWTQEYRDAVQRVIAAANLVAAGVPVRT